MANKKIKILMIDDDQFLLRMYSTKFTLEGFEMMAAEDPDEGLGLAREKRPDVILLDLIMPKKSGLEVLKEFKDDSATRDIPVILLSNVSNADERSQGLKLGAEDYLIKAHQVPSDVVKKVKEICEHKLNRQ